MKCTICGVKIEVEKAQREKTSTPSRRAVVAICAKCRKVSSPEKKKT
jgi:hypothetical protein